MNTELSNRLNNFEVQPSKGVWEKIQSQTTSYQPKGKSMTQWIWLGAAVAISLGVAFFMFTQKSVSPKSALISTEPIKNIEPQETIDLHVVAILPVTESTENQTISSSTEVSKDYPNEGKSEVISSIEVADEVDIQKVTPKVIESKLTKESHPKVIASVQEPKTPVAALSEITHETKIPSIRFGANPTICFGEDAMLTVEDGHQYRWNTGSVNSKIRVSPPENSTYTVTVTLADGQEVERQFQVNIDASCSALLLPSAFSPNGDGKNDFFKAEGNSIQKMQLFVFNQQGKTIFEANSIDQYWDGSLGGDLAPEGNYFYQVNYTDGLGVEHFKRGQVFLIR